MPVYYNTKTGATRDMKDSEFKKLKPDAQKRWRLASDSELKVHDKRMADNKILADKEAKRKKANVKSTKEKAKRYSSKAPKAEMNTEGSTDQAESAEPNKEG